MNGALSLNGDSSRRMRLPWPLVLMLAAACLIDGIVTLWGQPPSYWASPKFVNEADPLGRLALILSPHAFTMGLLLWAAGLVLLARRLPPKWSYPFWLAFFVGHMAGAGSWVYPIMYRRFYVDGDAVIVMLYVLVALVSIPAALLAYRHIRRASERGGDVRFDSVPMPGLAGVGVLALVFVAMPFIVGRVDIFKAIEADNSRLVERMLTEEPSLVRERNGELRTPLHIAAKGDHADLVVLLIEKGADMNATDEDGETPLYSAVRSRERAALPFLLASGSAVGAADEGGHTPLHLAAALGNEAAVRFLIGHKAEVNARDGQGRTPLHMAAGGRELLKPKRPDRRRSFARGRVVSALAAAGADVNAVDDEGKTPLHVAAEYGRRMVVEALLSNGADASVRDEEGRTALDVAKAKGRVDVAEPLR